MPINTAGTTQSNLLSIPRGCFRAAILDDNDEAGPFRNIGNVSEGSLEFQSEFAEHFTTCGEQRVRDARVPVETTVTLNLTLDHILDTSNLALILSADVDSRENPSATVAPLEGALVLPNPVYVGADALDDQRAVGRFYSLWVSQSTSDFTTPGVNSSELRVFAGRGSTARYNLNPGGGSLPALIPFWTPDREIFKLDAAQVEIEGGAIDGSGGGATYTAAGGAFTINANTGRIFIPNTGALATEIASLGAANPASKYVVLQLRYNASIPSVDVTNVEGLTRTSRNIAIEIEQQDTNRSGYRSLFSIFKTRLTTDGEYPLIQADTEFATVELGGSLERPSWSTSGATDLNGFFNKREDLSQ